MAETLRQVLHIYQDGATSKLALRELRPDPAASRTQSLPIAHGEGATLVHLCPSAYAKSLHNAPRRQFVLHIAGGAEVETTDGKARRVEAGDLVFMEDVSGDGHRTRLDPSVHALYVPVAPDFDFERWLAGGAAT